MIKSFEDLVFNEHPVVPGGVQAKHTLDNGVIISVVGGKGLYGDGVNDFEVGAWIEGSKEWIPLGSGDDVIGYRTKDEVTQIIETLNQLIFNK